MTTSPSQMFLELFKSKGGQRLWETRCSADGEKFVLECWEFEKKQLILQRWRNGDCNIFRQDGLGKTLKAALEEIAEWLGETVGTEATVGGS